ncbi:MAG: ribosome maturation factor RimM [Haliangium ochraceum]
MTRASYDPDSVLVGIIGRPHGLSGEVTLRAYNPHGRDLAAVRLVILEQDNVRRSCAVRGVRRGTDGWLLRLEGVDSRDAAAALVHVPVRVPKNLLPPLEAGEFFVEDLLGCQVDNEQGERLGTITSVFWNGAQDVMSIAPPAPEGAPPPGEILIPVVPAFVRAVDAPGRRVLVAWDGHD